MKDLLANKFNFSTSSILMLTDEGTDPYWLPTKHNMRMALRWLVQDCRPGDSLVFHFSGYGAQQRDYPGDKSDDDETLLPLDFENQGMILDDEINETIVRPLPRGVKLHAFIDACHSGTALDLPFLYRMDRLCQRRFPSGAMTSFIEAIGRGHDTSYGNMLMAMSSLIETEVRPISTSLTAMLSPGGSPSGEPSQEPQLTASVEFDVFSNRFYI